MDSIVQSIVDSFSSSASREVVIFIISMLPVLELRGGMLAAGLLHVDMVRAAVVCFFGTMLPIPFILLFIRQIFDWLRNTRFVKFVRRMEEKVEEKSGKIKKFKYLGLFLFVAIPLPGTGAWTGALIAAVLGMRFKQSFFSILAGTAAADVIMCILSYGVLGFVW